MLVLASGGTCAAVLFGEHEPLLACVEVRDFGERWPEVDALPGAAELLRSAAGGLGWDEGAFPADFGEREVMTVAQFEGAGRVGLARLSGSAASARGCIDASWDPRLGEALT